MLIIQKTYQTLLKIMSKSNKEHTQKSDLFLKINYLIECYMCKYTNIHNVCVHIFS